MLGEFCKDFADDMGIAVCGEFDEEDKFIYEYYYPYLRGEGVTTSEDVSVERHIARDSYAGVVEDVNMGVSMIFYLQNMIPYVSAQTSGRLPIRGTTLTLSGLSLGGKILFPIHVDEQQKDQIRRRTTLRNQLIEEARKVFLYGELPDWRFLGAAFMISLLVLHLGFLWFHKTKKGFADVL